jgi:hypothetical protein
MSADPNRLLFAISARKTMRWSDFCVAVDILSELDKKGRTPNGTATRSGLLQCLEALGHCDSCYSNGNSTITIAPPSLCRLPQAGFPIAVLTGARSLITNMEIRDAAQKHGRSVEIITKRQPGLLGLMPDTIMVRTTSEEAMSRFGEELGLHSSPIPPAWILVNWCGTLSEYEETLNYRHPEKLNWTRYDYCVNKQSFVHSHTESLPRFSRYRNPSTGLPLHVFYRNELGAETDLRWGQYLFLDVKGIHVIAYDEKRFRLCVPVKTPLPPLVARTVCLCSGKAPVYISRQLNVPGLECSDWLMFEEVPPQIALAALSKVGQSPARVEIR